MTATALDLLTAFDALSATEQQTVAAEVSRRCSANDVPPLRQDASGALRVGSSRVLLELVIHAFQDGATPETIVQRYSTVALADAYAVIAFYLRHRKEVEDYLARREQKAEEVRRRMDSDNGDLAEIRARMLAQKQA